MNDKLFFSQNSLFVLENKYLRKNEYGKINETPEQWFGRIAKALAKAEEGEKDRKKWEEKFLAILLSLEFLPGGRTLANAGTTNGQLANCFVLPFEDNVEEIFEAVKDSSILKKNGGGVGFSFSKIRPKGDLITGTTGAACGPVALMKILDSASEILLQDGGRRSGNMVILSVSHPDIFNFITCKEQNNVLNQINFSLGVNSRFMEAVVKDKNWDLINPRTGRAVQTVSARSIFELSTTSAWKNGDPGMIFLDRVNKDNPTPQCGPLEAVNLCGEQPLLSYEACNLGSVNLIKFIKKTNKTRNSKLGLADLIDWRKLEETVRTGVRMLDNVISVCKYPLAKVDRVVKSNRKIGLGVMGWGDALISLEIPYNSELALKFGEKVMKFIRDIGHEESKKIGREKGNFPNFEGSLWQKKNYRSMRNATVTTIAPTGSISMVAGVSSGIEPLFALSYYKEVIGGNRLLEINPLLLNKINNLKKEKKERDEIIERISKIGSIKEIASIPEQIKKIFVTAMDIDPAWHVKMQAAFQKYTDNAVSKTINLKSTATVKDVENAFLLAWKLGCKGITVYRDKSRGEQVLNVGDGVLEKKAQKEKMLKQIVSDKCPVCGGNLRIEEGCRNCPGCGWSACTV